MKSKGFTIIELVTTMAIISVLSLILIPNFQAWQHHYKLKNAAVDVYTHFQMARMNAIKNGIGCAITFYCAGDENDGYIVYEDTGNSPLEHEPGEKILARVFLKDYKGVSYDSRKGGGDGLTFFFNDDRNPSISFLPNGMTRTNNGGFGAGSVYLTNSGKVTRRVVISLAGNIRVETLEL